MEVAWDYIMRNAIEKLGGTIVVEAREGEWYKF